MNLAFHFVASITFCPTLSARLRLNVRSIDQQPESERRFPVPISFSTDGVVPEAERYASANLMRTSHPDVHHLLSSWQIQP
jgi:hypothetical protein